MKKPPSKRGGLQGDRHRPRSLHDKKTAGVKSRSDIWLENLYAEISRACDRFWTRTAERRLIEARRRARGFSDRSFPVEKTPSPPEKPEG
jgi:hypothetical protein